MAIWRWGRRPLRIQEPRFELLDLSLENENAMHETITAFLKSLEAAGRTGSLPSYELALRVFWEWAQRNAVNPLRATTETLQAYQRWLSNDYKTASGDSLKKSTQLTRLTPILSYYRYLEQECLILVNPGRKLKLPTVRRRVTPKDYLELQEATALIQTQAKYVQEFKRGSLKWAGEYRNLAMLCLAIATGRRRHALVLFHLSHLDLQRCELRVEWEKGKAGRVLPVAKWAVDVCGLFIQEARSIVLNGRHDKSILFPGSMNDSVAPCSFYGVLRRIHQRAANENPDLDGFGDKHLSPHGLRVSFATLLFKGGCNIRSINELMLHTNLSTTARYTPIPLEDLRRACRLAHPRA